MTSRRGVYLDACCFIEAVKQDLGLVPSSDRQSDVWHYKKLLEAHRDGEIQVFTSVLSIAECSHAEGDVSDSVRKTFRGLLVSGQYLSLIQPTPTIAEAARDLRWVHGMTLKGADALHLASALDRTCDEFITLDSRIKRIDNVAKFKTLGLTLCEGRFTACLPDRYRQMDLTGGGS